MTTNHGLDLSQAAWHKSSHSQGQGNNCIEVAKIGDHIAVRDSKIADSTALIFEHREWSIFLAEIKQR